MHELALVMIKPDAFERHLDETIRASLTQGGLEIIFRKNLQLDECLIRAYQPVLDEPSEFGEDWKKEVMVALTKRTVEILIVKGQDALLRVRLLKKRLRSIYCPGEDYHDRVIFNLLHTTDDQGELERNMGLLAPEAKHLS